MTTIIRRTFKNIADLPFVADIRVGPRRTRRNFWHVPLTDDHGAANAMGRQYACDLLQFFKEDPRPVGANIIGLIVKDMAAYPSGTAMRGYEVGFWSALELVLFRASGLEDHWSVIQRSQDRYDAIDKAREVEEVSEGARAVRAATPLTRASQASQQTGGAA